MVALDKITKVSKPSVNMSIHMLQNVMAIHPVAIC